jgi:hypothetical protein
MLCEAVGGGGGGARSSPGGLAQREGRCGSGVVCLLESEQLCERPGLALFAREAEITESAPQSDGGAGARDPALGVWRVVAVAPPRQEQAGYDKWIWNQILP